MNILRNPFHILGVSLYDTKERILEAVEEKSLLVDNEEELARCCAELINPKKRLLAEISWFITEDEISRIAVLETLQREPEKAIVIIENLKHSERFNVLLSALSAKPPTLSKDLSTWIVRIALEYEMIDVEELVEDIGDNRLASGFSVVDRRMVEEALLEQRNWCREVLKNVLDTLPPRELIQIVTTTVDQATNYGKKHAPGIIDDLVEAYEVEAQTFFTKETEGIERLLDLLKEYADEKKADDILFYLTDNIIKMVDNWASVVQPIQVSAQSRGVLHTPSQDIADLLRSASVTFFNEHDKIEIAQKINTMLRRNFARFPQIVEQLHEDAKTLKSIAQKRTQMAQQQKEWQKALEYQTNIGGLFSKKVFKMSFNGIEWEDKHWQLEEINRIRWGGIANGNSNPIFSIKSDSNISYQILWGEPLCKITTSNKDIFDNIANRLWKSVGIRLYIEMLSGFQKGKIYNFGPINCFDCGVSFDSTITLEHLKEVEWLNHELKNQNNQMAQHNLHHAYVSISRHHISQKIYTWSQVDIENHNGALYIAPKSQNIKMRLLSSTIGGARFSDFEESNYRFPYLDFDNIMILEAAIRNFMKNKNIAFMSSLLEM
jgi:hypothetical protein